MQSPGKLAGRCWPGRLPGQEVKGFCGPNLGLIVSLQYSNPAVLAGLLAAAGLAGSLARELRGFVEETLALL